MTPAFTAMSVFQTILGIAVALFALYLTGHALFLCISAIVGSLQLRRREKRGMRHKSQILSDTYIPISVIIPAYNEDNRIINAVQSALNLDYSLYEIIVVDDGSTDNTAKNLINAFQLREIKQPIRRQLPCACEETIYLSRNHKVPITLVKKVHGGKSDALNMGINTSQYPYFISVDINSELQTNALARLSIPLIENDNVVVVEGQVKPADGEQTRGRRAVKHALPKKNIAAIQSLDRNQAYLATHILLDRLNGNFATPVPFCLFRKDVVIECGGYNHNACDETIELVAKLHAFCRGTSRPYAVRYAPDAICRDKAINSTAALLDQHTHYRLGLREVFTQHGSAFADIHFGLGSFAAYSYFLMYELLSPVIALLGILVTILAVACNLISVLLAIALFSTYVIFRTIMLTIAFFSSAHADNIHVSARETIRVVGLSLLDVTALRFAKSVTYLRTLCIRDKTKAPWAEATCAEINAE